MILLKLYSNFRTSITDSDTHSPKLLDLDLTSDSNLVLQWPSLFWGVLMFLSFHQLSFRLKGVCFFSLHVLIIFVTGMVIMITSENLMFYGKIYLIWVLLTLLMNFVSEFRWELINNPHHKHQVNSQSQWFSFAFAAAIAPRNH